MNIKTKKRSYEQVMALPRPKHRNPLRPLFLLQLLIRILAILDLVPTRFKFRKQGMDKIGKKEPCLILMNHSSFTDLKLAYGIFFPKPLCIVSTGDSYVGKRWLMPLIGLLLGLTGIGCPEPEKTKS